MTCMGGRMMRKVVLLVLTVTLMILFIFVVYNNRNNNVNESAQPNESQENKEEIAEPEEVTESEEFENVENPWSEAYLNVINNLINQYGEGAIEAEENDITGAEVMTGVGIVRLIDFDGNGTYELYCAYADGSEGWVNRQIIYGYDNGLVVLLEESEVSNPGTDITPETTFLSKDGNVYLVEKYEMKMGNYYTLQNGEMISVLSYMYGFGGESDTLNGASATYEEVQTAIEEMESGGTMEQISFYYDVSTTELIKTKDTIAKIKDIDRQ